MLEKKFNVKLVKTKACHKAIVEFEKFDVKLVKTKACHKAIVESKNGEKNIKNSHKKTFKKILIFVLN